MSKPKVKINKNITELFNQMLGIGCVNASITYPKYLEIRANIAKTADLLDVFCNKSAFLKSYEEFATQRAEINAFIAECRDALDELLYIEFAEEEYAFNNIDETRLKQFSECYNAIKKSSVVRHLIATGNNLVIWKEYIGDDTALNSKFISSMSGAEFTPMSFTSLNFKYIVDMILSDACDAAQEGADTAVYHQTIQFLMIILNRMFNLTHSLYRVITRPDIDIDEFADVIISSINETRKQLPHCEEAFHKIEQSVNLLKARFQVYHRDFLETDDPLIILHNFVNDVSKTTKANTRVMMQFTRIMKHYRKMAGSHAKIAQLDAIFDKFTSDYKSWKDYQNLHKDLLEGDDGSGEDVEFIEEDNDDDDDDDNGDEFIEERERNAQLSVDELAAMIEKSGVSKKQ